MHIFTDRLMQNSDSKVDVLLCDAHWRLDAEHLFHIYCQININITTISMVIMHMVMMLTL